MAKLKFKDFLAVDYMPGEDDLIKKNAKKRKGGTTGGANVEYSSTHAPRSEEVEVDEALSMAQRLQRSRQFKRYKSRIKLGREKAARRLASDEQLMKRARKAARNILAKRMTQDIPKAELTFARRQEIEKRLDKMGSKIDKLAKRMLPKVRKADRDKKRGK